MQYNLNFSEELIVDNFAGGGGASIGIEAGSNRFVDIAINHDKTALEVHELNHPHTEHIQSDVFEVDPVEVCKGNSVGLAWFSPDCRHFSKAKGGKPVEKKIRGLAWVARIWAKKVKPRIIVLENVEEFLTWGPLRNGKPDPKRKGFTFQAFNSWFLRNGYHAEYRILKACDYGAPTIRKRLFWIARCDGEAIVWPKPTHGPKNSVQVKKKKLKPYRTAAECIDFSLPCPSIFMNKTEVKAFNKQNGTRIRRPLADATLKRIAKGIVKFVVEEKQPFIVPISNYNGSCVAHPVNEPLRTVTASPKGGAFAMCNPTLIQMGYGERKGQSPRTLNINEPLGTVVGTGVKHAICSPFIAPIANYSSGVVVDSGKYPLRTVTTRNNFAVCTPYIARDFNQSIGSSLKDPVGSITAGGGGKAKLVSAFLAKHYTGVTGSDLKEPMGTVTAIDHHSLIQCTLSKEEIKKGAERVAAFLIKYYGQGYGQNIKAPLHTLSTKDRFSLVTVHIKGEPWVIVDIGMRMLTPYELMIAQSFPKDYNLGNNSKTTKVRLIGNSVPPPFAEAIVKANFNTLNTYRRTA